jgi:hypothetical protein
MMQNHFPLTNIEMGIIDQNQKYDFLFTGSLESDFISKKYLSFLNPHSITYILFQDGKMYHQNSD